MCYDISFTVELRVLGDYFPDLVFDEQIKIDFSLGEHIAGHAHADHPVIYRNRKDQLLHCRLMEWGCIPFYVKDLKAFAKQRSSMLNARSERVVDDKSSYWYKIRNRRCLVPVKGIYEHRAIRGWKKKVPYYITIPGQGLFFLPGLYSMVETTDTETGEITQLPSFTIITRRANSLMKNIHNDGDNRNRMPLFLTRELASRWLEKEEMTEDEIREILDFEMPADALDALPVFTIRSAKQRPDNKAKNEYWEWEKLPALGELNPD
ncbi:MAG: SOS response-associated peptidase [Chitinophagaceae bacterium]|nr:MAG: SOS response-associated peptidase [Chitinophagaceae bacterium]